MAHAQAELEEQIRLEAEAEERLRAQSKEERDAMLGEFWNVERTRDGEKGALPEALLLLRKPA